MAPLLPRPGGIHCHLARLVNVPYAKRSLYQCMEELKLHVGKLMSVRGVVLSTGAVVTERAFQVVHCTGEDSRSNPLCDLINSTQYGQREVTQNQRG